MTQSELRNKPLVYKVTPYTVYCERVIVHVLINR